MRRVIVPPRTVRLNAQRQVSKVIERVTSCVKHKKHGLEGGHSRAVETVSHLSIFSYCRLLEIVESQEGVDETVEDETAGVRWVLFVPVVLPQKSGK